MPGKQQQRPLLPVPRLATADVCDAMGDAVQVVVLPFSDYGGRLDFAGPVATVRTLDDNSFVKSMLETPGEDRVLVVDGGGSLRSALVGGNLADLGVKNGWAGILVHGCVRDAHELIAADIGVKALGLYPKKSEKLGRGETGVAVTIGGVIIEPGMWLTADKDGVVVTKSIPSL